MNVGFLHVGPDLDLPRLMVESVKRHMPGARILQMTDRNTPAIAETQRARYDGKHLMTFRMDHLAALPAGEWLILDTDAIVQRDVSGVFKRQFDVALTRRRSPILDPSGVDVTKAMPYNSGVMFCRNPEFWARCAEVCHSLPEDQRVWWGDQLAIAAVAPEFNTLDLPCGEFNYTPGRISEDVSNRAIVHYKGNRKAWMLNMERRIA